MHFSLNMVPVPQWTHRTFEGVDPWSDNGSATWTLVVYAMLSETFAGKMEPEKQTTPANSNEVPGHLAIGIAQPGGQYHILPMAVRDLWRTGQIRDQDLPVLLHRMEGRLKTSDYPPDKGSCVALAVGAFSALVFVLAGVVSLFAPAQERIIDFTSTPEWLAKPMAARQVTMMQPVPAAALSPVSVAISPPAGYGPDQYHAPGRSQLAAVAAGSEYRLVLISVPKDLDNPGGVVLARSALSIPDSAVAPIKQQFPSLNTDYVLCVGWKRLDALSPFDVELYSTMKQFMYLTGPLALLCMLPIVLRRLRRQSVARTAMRLLRSS
ncbi:MAG: hypothetical protein U0Q16_31405 [Bryobacteraceae bacterium]